MGGFRYDGYADMKKTLKIIGVTLLVCLVAAVGGCVYQFYDWTHHTEKSYAGEAATATFTYKELVPLPPQHRRDFPMVWESHGMFDFSSLILFEADAAWTEALITRYGLTREESAWGTRYLAEWAQRPHPQKEAAQMAKNLGSDWVAYSAATLDVRNQPGQKGCFVLFVHPSRTQAVLYYYSFYQEK